MGHAEQVHAKHGVPQALVRQEPGLGRWCILSAYRGSIAHGMYVPASSPTSIDDKDLMVVCVPSREYYVGLTEYGSRGTVEIKQGAWDIVIYEVRKMIRMLLEGNPNVLSLLWVDPKHHLTVTSAGQLLLRSRRLFVGRHVYHSFAGYAESQFKRMTHLAFQGYMGEKRKRLVEQFGYDTKNAAHLIRLLRMCIEFLTDGELEVTRPDAAELLAIKQGQWRLERVQEEADRLFAQAKRAHQRSTLPEAPQHERVNRLCVQIIQTAWDTRKK
jgi:predicted nucleotidyltransferase